MEVKKTRRADLEKGKSRWLFMGLIVTLSFMFVSFEWTERNVTYTISDLVSDPDFFEELVPVTYNQDKPLPAPPPPAAVGDVPPDQPPRAQPPRQRVRLCGLVHIQMP